MTTSSPITPKSKRAVCFSPEVHVKKTLHLNDYSCKELVCSWFTETEIYNIRSHAMQTVHQMESNSNNDDPALLIDDQQSNKQSCSRGLEFLTQEGCRLRAENRARAWDAVLAEQDLQIDEDIYDDDAIAAVYSDCCYSSAVAASIQGVSDQTQALGHSSSFNKTKTTSAKKTTSRSSQTTIYSFPRTRGRVSRS